MLICRVWPHGQVGFFFQKNKFKKTLFQFPFFAFQLGNRGQDSADTCDDWRNVQNYGRYGSLTSKQSWFDAGQDQCVVERPLFCLQVPLATPPTSIVATTSSTSMPSSTRYYFKLLKIWFIGKTFHFWIKFFSLVPFNVLILIHVLSVLYNENLEDLVFGAM